MKSNPGIAGGLIGGMVALILASMLPVTISNSVFLMAGVALTVYYVGVHYAIADGSGIKRKTVYKVIQYSVASLFLLLWIADLTSYLMDNNRLLEPDYLPNYFFKKICFWIVDLSLILYLFFFKPSSCTTFKKILKFVGSIMIFISIIMLTQVRTILVISYYGYPHTYEEVQYNFMAVVISIVLLSIGLVLKYISYRHTKDQFTVYPETT